MKCRKCQATLPYKANFCHKCGHALDSKDPQSKSIAIPDAERKRVTALFSDLSGYSAITEKLDPEEVKEITSCIFDGVRKVVDKYEGFIERFEGDGFLGLFGVPRTHEDHPIRAIRAALEIHKFVVALSPKFEGKVGRELSMHSGINTGLAVTADTDPGKDTYGITGDAINLAARLSGLAAAGDILVGADTHKASKSHFIFKAMAPKEVKGKSESIQVYKLLSDKTPVSHSGRKRQVFSKMVGRNREMAMLESQTIKVINGQGSVVNVIGEAGIGKSRLIAEYKRKSIMKPVTLLEGRAISVGKNLSFHPIIDLLKQWAQIGEDDSESKAFDKLESSIREIYPEETDEILPFIATLMGMKFSGRNSERVKGIEGEALEKMILKNVRDLLLKATDLTPLVIVTEDLQWADTSSLELLLSLFGLARTRRIIFINVFRSGYRETGDRIAAISRKKFSEYSIEIVLQALDDSNSEAIIHNMVGIRRHQHPVIDKIVQKADGNPFFIEEIVRSFIDEGAIVIKNGSFEVTEKIDTMVVPDRIKDVLTARIDRLEEKTRELIKVASVIGRNFFYRIIAEVAKTIEDIDGRLEYLKDIQLIRERRRMEELEYLFKHALVQETAYESILLQKRRRLHGTIAEAIERVFKERLHEFYGMLAFHYSNADEPEKTEEYMMKAGEEALKTSASSEALHYYQEALSLYLMKYGDTADPEKVAILEKNIAIAMFNRGQYEEAVKYFEKALNFFWGELPKHPIPATFQFFSEFIHLLISLYLPFLKFRKIPKHHDNVALDLFLKKLKVLSVVNPKRFFVESLHFYKRVANFDLSQFEPGIGLFVGASTLFSFTSISFRLSRKILDFAKNKVYQDNAKIYIIYELCETIHNYMKGNWKRIKELDDDLINQNLRIGEIYWASQNIYWHGCQQIFQGYVENSNLLINKLSNIFEIYENNLPLLLRQMLLTSLLVEYRKLNDALIEIDEGIELGQKIKSGLSLIYMFAWKARINILMGDIEEAEKNLEHADKIRGEVDSVPWQLSTFQIAKFEIDLYRIEESLRNGNSSKLFKYRKQSKKSCNLLLKLAQKVAQHRTESYRLMGAYKWSMNRQKSALKWWKKSIQEGGNLGAHPELARTYMEVGKRLLGPESKCKELNGVNAEEYLDKAKIMFEAMDLQWDLDELSKLN